MAAVAALFFFVTVVLLIVFIMLCVRRCNSTTMVDLSPKRQEASNNKQFNSMQPNAVYEGDTDSPYPLGLALPQQAINRTSDYNTITSGDYEIVGPGGRPGEGGSNYQRLQRPTLTPSMMTRFVSSPETTVFSPSTTMTSVFLSLATLDDDPTKTNGRVFGAVPPPPLPNSTRPVNMGKLPNSPESSATIDSPFVNGSADVGSPLERYPYLFPDSSTCTYESIPWDIS